MARDDEDPVEAELREWRATLRKQLALARRLRRERRRMLKRHAREARELAARILDAKLGG